MYSDNQYHMFLIILLIVPLPEAVLDVLHLIGAQLHYIPIVFKGVIKNLGFNSLIHCFKMCFKLLFYRFINPLTDFVV